MLAGIMPLNAGQWLLIIMIVAKAKESARTLVSP